jgi:hypothetical protein
MRLALDVYAGAMALHARLLVHSLGWVVGLAALAALGGFLLRHRGAWLRYALGSGCLLTLIGTHSLILILSWQTPALALQVGTRHFSVVARDPLAPEGSGQLAAAAPASGGGPAASTAGQGASAAAPMPNPGVSVWASEQAQAQARVSLRWSNDKNIDMRFLL